MLPKSRFSTWILGLAATTMLGGCGVIARSVAEQTTGYISPSPTEAARARAAWAYFRASRSGQTGMVEAISGAGFTTPAAIGDQIAATIAADRLRIIDRREFDDTISATLAFLAAMPLSNGEMPARFYSTRDGTPMDPPNAGSDPGWSAVEAGRLLVWLRILAQRYPVYEPFVAKAVARWETCRAIDEAGQLRRSLPGAQGFVNTVDTGTGYADYAAQGFRAWGETVSPSSTEPGGATVSVEGAEFPLAGREPLHSVPLGLLAIEFGWKTPQGAGLGRERAVEQQLWDAQTARWKRTGIATARADFRRTAAPYALTDAVLAAGYPWSTADHSGAGQSSRAYPELALVSTRAATLLAALHDGDHAEHLSKTVETLYDPGAGWYEGRYEATGAYEWTRTSATNAAVLETLLYRHVGPLFDKRKPLGTTATTTNECALADLGGGGR